MLPTKDKIFVIIQFALFSCFLFIKERSIHIPVELRRFALVFLAIGVIVIIVSLLQLSKNLSPFPTPKSDAVLIEHGLYRYVRHPIYTGILLSAFGISTYWGSFYLLIVSAVLLLLFYFKASYEERLLIQRYDGYPAYKAKTKMLVPFLW